MEVRPPCENCPDRTTGPDRRPCHTTCERYAAYKAEHDKEVAARDKYWKVHGAIQEGKRRRQTVPSWEIHGTFKERRRESGKKGPVGASDRWTGKYTSDGPGGQEGRKTAAKRQS